MVCGHYLPELGYLEVHLARAWANAGHSVLVVTSSAVPAYVQSRIKSNPVPGPGHDGEVEILRLKPLFSLGQLVWARGIRKAIDSFAPELVMVIGLGKVFPEPVLRKGKYRLGILLGDNSHTFLKITPQQRIIQRLLKKPVYEKGIQSADRIFTYTPETESVLSNWLSEQSQSALKEKNVPLSLGFDHRTFFYSAKLRSEKRRELKIEEDEVLIISVARMGPNKDFTSLIEDVEKLVDTGEKLKCLFVGVGDDTDSIQLKNRIEKTNCPEAFMLKPFQSHTNLNAFYNAADIGYWPITAISVFEGMGTGLVLLLPPDAALSHLRDAHKNVVFSDDDLRVAMEDAVKKVQSFLRTERAALAVDKFAYKSLAQKIVESAQSG